MFQQISLYPWLVSCPADFRPSPPSEKVRLVNSLFHFGSSAPLGSSLISAKLLSVHCITICTLVAGRPPYHFLIVRITMQKKVRLGRRPGTGASMVQSNFSYAARETRPQCTSLEEVSEA